MNSRELFRQALHSLLTNRLRSALTLVGIILGVASIIAVMTALALVQATFEHEMSVLGSQTFQVRKWPAGGFASDAVRDGLRGIGEGPGPVNALGIAARSPTEVRPRASGAEAPGAA